VAGFEENDRDATFVLPRYPSIRRSGCEEPSTELKSTKDGG
jgi:hypothetical protein